jgi:hypothetical protein
MLNHHNQIAVDYWATIEWLLSDYWTFLWLLFTGLDVFNSLGFPFSQKIFRDCFLGCSQNIWLDKTAVPSKNRLHTRHFVGCRIMPMALKRFWNLYYWSKTTNIFSINICQDFFRTLSSKYRNWKINLKNKFGFQDFFQISRLGGTPFWEKKSENALKLTVLQFPLIT